MAKKYTYTLIRISHGKNNLNKMYDIHDLNITMSAYAVK
jgi:hypothetical protein